MSQENVEFVRQLYPPGGVDMVALFSDLEQFKRGIGPFLHQNFEARADPQQVGLDALAARGATDVDGFASACRDWLQAWEAFQVVPTEFIAAPNNRVLVLQENRIRSRTGGVEMAFESGVIWTLEDGLLRRIEVFIERSKALEAAGLKE